MADETVRRHVTAEGEVQGVFFREATRRKATEAGVAGWVANRSDGKLEAVFEGPAEAVDELVDFCRDGPTAATVEKIDVRDEEPEGLTGFDVR
jgi:acylphosphatase